MGYHDNMSAYTHVSFYLKLDNVCDKFCPDSMQEW